MTIGQLHKHTHQEERFSQILPPNRNLEKVLRPKKMNYARKIRRCAQYAALPHYTEYFVYDIFFLSSTVVSYCCCSPVAHFALVCHNYTVAFAQESPLSLLFLLVLVLALLGER